MSPRAKPVPDDHGKLESQIQAEKIEADLEACKSQLAELESKLSAAALDLLGEPAAFEKLEADVASARNRARQLGLALEEAHRRTEIEYARRRADAHKQDIIRAEKALAARDAAGAVVEARIAELAGAWRNLMTAGFKAHDRLSVLIPEIHGQFGYITGTGELETAVANELWRVSFADASDFTGDYTRVKPLPALPGSERLARLDGSPEPWLPSTAPSLSSRLRGASNFALAIVKGDRRYDGKSSDNDAASDPTRWHFPGREDRVAVDAKRAAGEVPPRRNEPTIAGKIAKRITGTLTGHASSSAKRSSGPARIERLPGEDDTEFLRRLAAAPVGKISAEERAELNRPKGPKISAAEAQVLAMGGRPATREGDGFTRGKRTQEDW